MSSMQELKDILRQYQPRPDVLSTDGGGGLNFSLVANPHDRRYLNDLARVLKSFNPGNPNLNIGFNFIDEQYWLWLLHFEGDYDESHFRLLAQVPHPIANWVPIRENGVKIGEVPGWGVGIRVFVTPLPNAVATLPAPVPRPQLPAPQQIQPILFQQLPAPPTSQQQHQAGPIIVHEASRRDASPKRETRKGEKKPPKKSRAKQRRSRKRRKAAPTGLLAGLAQSLVGAPETTSSSSSSSAESSSG